MTPEELKIQSLELHRLHQGKIETTLKVPIETKADLSLAYSPGVAEPCLEIAKNPELAKEYTLIGRTIAVISDGSAVLGLGNIGPLAAMPVMEGKSALFKRFAGLDSVPIILATQDTEEIIAAIKAIAPSFGGINLEDISAPRCFEIEERLKNELDIPIMHDDQHGTAIVTLAGLTNALRVVQKDKNVKIVVNGPGAAGTAVIKLLLLAGFKNITACDREGIISHRRNDLDSHKKMLADITSPSDGKNLADAIKHSDVIIGLSGPGAFTQEMVRTMNSDAIVFGLANPLPEILPELAYEAGARVVATGRSDYPNQLNNILAFPGIFRGCLTYKAKKITDEMKLKAAYSLANAVENPSEKMILPDPFDPRVPELVAQAMKPE